MSSYLPDAKDLLEEFDDFVNELDHDPVHVSRVDEERVHRLAGLHLQRAQVNALIAIAEVLNK